MRPVKNTSFRYFDIGMVHRDGIITGFTPCMDRESCKRIYENFDIACGGDRRMLNNGLPICLFFIASGDTRLLSGELDGKPIE